MLARFKRKIHGDEQGITGLEKESNEGERPL